MDFDLEVSPENMVLFLLQRHNQNFEDAILEAREVMISYKNGVSKKQYWCEVIYQLEHHS